MVVDYGFPNRTYFEIFAGTCPSDKIYSMQVADWNKHFAMPVQKGSQENTHIEYQYQDTAAVVQVDMEQHMTSHKDHMQVEPTADLIEYLAARGVRIPDTIYIQPLAFAWSRDGEFEVEEEVVTVPVTAPDEDKESNNKTKAILAAIMAAVALLN